MPVVFVKRPGLLPAGFVERRIDPAALYNVKAVEFCFAVAKDVKTQSVLR